MSDWTFHPRYVEPFYLHFMNGNIVHEPPEVRTRLLTEFRLLSAELDDRQIGEMLESSWRSAKVAAWHVAYGRRAGLIPRIQALLIEQPAHVEHLCIALACVSHPETRAALLSYLEGCASGALLSHWDDEAVRPEWAVCVLRHLDAAGESPAADELWVQFLARLNRALSATSVPSRFETALLSSWTRRLDGARKTLGATLALLDQAQRAD